MWGEGSDRVGDARREDARGGAGRGSPRRKAWKAEGVRRRLRLDHRARPSTAAGRSPRDYDRAYREIVEPATRSRRRARSASASAWWRPRSSPTRSPRCARLPAPAVARRDHRLPALLRAGRRLRPRRHPDQGRARRRRVDPHRPEGVDVGRAVLRHRRDHHPHRHPTSRSTRASRCSSSTCTRPASRCGRCAR